MPNKNLDGKKAISIIVPAFNEANFIDQCLNSIKSKCHTIKLDYELIVIDNGSTDSTRNIALKYTNKVKSIERSSVSYARNLGASLASYDLLVFIDGDVFITTQWVTTLLKHYEDYIKNPLFIAGHQCTTPQAGSWIERHWFSNLIDKLFGGANIITTKTAFEHLRGFDITLKTGEDYDFCIRAINSEFRYLNEPGYEAVHLGFPKTIGGFIRRELWHGEGDFKSIKTFFSSPVALIAAGYLILQLLVVALLLTGYFNVAAILFACLILGNLMLTCLRFRRCRLITLILNSFLNYMYFSARAASGIRRLLYRHRNH